MRSPGYPNRIVGRENTDNLGNVFVLAEASHTDTGDKRLLRVGPIMPVSSTNGRWRLRKAFSGWHAILFAGGSRPLAN
jgi:hypothetical protein